MHHPWQPPTVHTPITTIRSGPGSDRSGYSMTLPRGGGRTLAAFWTLTTPFSYLHMDTNTEPHKRIMDEDTGCTPNILLLAGPLIEDRLDEMRHDAGLLLRLILCLSACLVTAHKSRERVLFFAPVIEALTLFCPLLPFIWQLSYGSMVTGFVLLSTASVVIVVFSR